MGFKGLGFGALGALGFRGSGVLGLGLLRFRVSGVVLLILLAWLPEDLQRCRCTKLHFTNTSEDPPTTPGL